MGPTWTRKPLGGVKNHLAGMAFVVNQALPPLPFCSDKFDFVYAISVFSHLDETYATIWLQELQRLAAPNPILAIAICGPLIYQATARDVVELHEKGLLFTSARLLEEPFSGLVRRYVL